MAMLVFSREDEQIYLLDQNGNQLDSWDAGNNVSNPNGRPCEEGSNGQAPTGTWDIDWGVQTRSGAAYGGDNQEFIPVGNYGADGLNPSDEAAERGIGIHGGRTNYESTTHGCIRMNDDDMDSLEDYFQTQTNNNDPIESIAIIEDSFDSNNFDADDVDSECDDTDPPEEEGSSFTGETGGGNQ